MPARHRQNEDYGKGEHRIDLEDDLEALAVVDPTGCVETLLERFRSPTYRPPVLPGVALKLMELTRRAEVTYKEVASLVEQEPLTAVQVLRLAESPVYRRGDPIRTIEQAMTRLGLRTLSDLFLQASLNARVFRAPGYDVPMKRLRLHSAETARIARLVCRETSIMDEYAFLCGLLHDVGEAAIMIALAESRSPNAKPLSPPQLALIVHELHEVASARLAEIWQLPADIRIVIGHHHGLVYQGRVHPLAAIVCIAHSIAEEIEQGTGRRTKKETVARAQSALDLSDRVMEGLRTAAGQAVRRRTRSIW